MHVKSFWRKRDRKRLERHWLNKAMYSLWLQKTGMVWLLKALISDVWFRWFFVGFLALLVFLGLFLPKIWLATPADFVPKIRVSGLDMAQAWSLKRTALRAEADGRKEEAREAWQMALAHNQADPELRRGLIQNLLGSETRTKFMETAMGNSMLLLRLTKTNEADLNLAVRVAEKFQIYDLAYALLIPYANRPMSPALEATFLRAQFHLGMMDAFDKGWASRTNQAAGDADLQLYRTAFLTGWGPPATRSESRRKLETAMADPVQGALANRLMTFVSTAMGEPWEYSRALQGLEKLQADTLLDHLGYWLLLARSGQKAEAIRLAQDYYKAPATTLEIIRLAQVNLELGLREPARLLLQQYVTAGGSMETAWTLYGNLLVEDESWEALRILAAQLRTVRILSETLAGYSYYLDGQAEAGLGRPALAEIAFRKAAEQSFPNKALGLTAALQILKRGYPAIARDLLAKFKDNSLKDFSYWTTMFAVAYALKDADLLLSSATAAYQLRPQDVGVANNYAAALLINRVQSEEAIKVSMQLMAKAPDSPAARINHSMALAHNQRPLEAIVLLSDVRIDRLTDPESTAYHLARLESYLGLGQKDQARKVIDRIDPKYLFPSQIQWLEKTRKEIAPDNQTKP